MILQENLAPRGIEVELVAGRDLYDWTRTLSSPSDVVFFEAPSNPMQKLVDIAAVSELAHAAGAIVMVDNLFATPILSQPIEHGADVAIYSVTKHFDGHGRVLGGAILGSKTFIEGPVKQMMMNIGPTISPFNAWILVKASKPYRFVCASKTESPKSSPPGYKNNPALARSTTRSCLHTRSMLSQRNSNQAAGPLSPSKLQDPMGKTMKRTSYALLRFLTRCKSSISQTTSVT